MLRAACYGQNGVLQPYDLPVTRGGQICLTLQSETMGEEGFEFVQETTGNTVVSNVCNAESNVDAAGWHIPVAQDDPDLQKLIDAWRSLPAPMRAAICSIVQAARVG